jgi:hypothetical protein
MKVVDLQFEEGGVEYLKPCFAVTLYWTGSMFERAEGLLEMYRRAWEIVGPAASLYQTDSMKSARKVKADTGDLIPTWLQDAPGQRMMYILRVDNRAQVGAASDTGFLFYATEYKEVGAFSFWMPAESAESDPESLVGLVAEMASAIPFASGHAGYSLDYDPRGEYRVVAREKLAALVRRHPGLDVPCVENTSFAIHDGFKRVSWLTLVGAELTERLGGADAIEGRLGEGIEVRRLETGVLVRAGPRPEIGDVNRRESLPLYHEVGRVLAPVRAREHPAVLYPPDSLVASDDKTREWLELFDN